MKTWFEFYKDKCYDGYFQYVSKKYYPFIKEVSKHIKPFMKIGEFGCGMGNITKALMDYQPNAFYHLIDNSNSMLDLAEKNIDTFNISIKCWDILSEYPLTFDVIHSHGVLEHFNDTEIKIIIENQLNICDTLIHYVPSNKYNYKSFGDERLLTKEYWQYRFNPSEVIEFNDGYDLILIWRVDK